MYTMRELGGLLSALQTSQAQQAPNTETVASAFDLDQNIEYPLGYCDRRLYDISREVRLLQARLRFLAREEESGRIAKLRARNHLQPVGRLPNEVISNILLFSMIHCGALIWCSPLLAVSHRWRDCALSESMIWREVVVVADTQKEELITWLARSQNAPLFVIYGFPKGNQPLQEHFAMTQSLIAPHAGRLRRLEYDVGFPTNAVFPLSVIPPSLEALSVRWEKNSSPIPPSNVFVEGAPLGLRELRLTLSGAASAQVVLNDFDASALVALHVDHAITSPSIWSTLSRSHLLEDLEWTDVTTSVDAGALELFRQGVEPVNLKYLRSLTLVGQKTLPALAHLDMPVLERLKIAVLSTSWLRDAFPEILRRDQLQRLALYSVGSLQAHQLRDIFTSLPQLQYFIHDAWTAESIPAVDVLTPPATMNTRGDMDSWCCPSLRVLCIEYSPLPSSDDPASPAQKQLIQAMKKYIGPLLFKRRLYASQPLTVILEYNDMLEALLGLEGIVWDSFYTWPDE